MKYAEEQKIFDNYVGSKGLKQSDQRREILHAFLRTEGHVTADELHKIVKKRNPTIGIATIYRTLKLLNECGLSIALKLEDGSVKYEHFYNHKHHDHLVCLQCGEVQEVFDPEIEKIQEKLAKKNGFTLQGHKHLLYGLCRTCKN
jgi:Fur family ferric uptake transcriptional regulator